MLQAAAVVDSSTVLFGDAKCVSCYTSGGNGRISTCMDETEDRNTDNDKKKILQGGKI